MQLFCRFNGRSSEAVLGIPPTIDSQALPLAVAKGVSSTETAPSPLPKAIYEPFWVHGSNGRARAMMGYQRKPRGDGRAIVAGGGPGRAIDVPLSGELSPQILIEGIQGD